MKNKNKVTKSGTGAGHVVGSIPKNLGELRARFDGYKDELAKLPDSPIKAKVITGIEELYLGAANWFTGVHGNATEHSV